MIKKIILLLISLIIVTGCLKKMEERDITVTVEGDNPLNALKSITREVDKAQVLLLGVPSLNILQKDFAPELLDSLILSLSHFKPEIICINEPKPEEISRLLSNSLASKYFSAEKLKELQNLGSLQKSLKINFEQAKNISDSLLNIFNMNDWSFNDAERINLIQHLLATFDIFNAALHWAELSESQRNKSDLSSEIKQLLDGTLNSNNEKSSIGLRLASKLKVHRVYPINDLSDRPYLDEISEKLYDEMLLSEVYLNSRRDILDTETDRVLKSSLKEKNLLRFFLHINSDQYKFKSTVKEWGIYYKMFLDSGLDRTRAALWEMKNLRIAANIREATALYPGIKVLVLMDVSSKPFLEEYLKSLNDVTVVSLSSIK